MRNTYVLYARCSAALRILIVFFFVLLLFISRWHFQGKVNTVLVLHIYTYAMLTANGRFTTTWLFAVIERNWHVSASVCSAVHYGPIIVRYLLTCPPNTFVKYLLSYGLAY